MATTTSSHCVPVTALSDGSATCMKTAESSSTGSCSMEDEKNACDDAFRVRQRKETDIGGGQVRKICEVCGKVFQHYESFRSHKRLHTGWVPCRSKQFPLNTQPNGSKTTLPLMCEVCGLRGKNSAAFARHMRSYHPSAVGIDNTGAPFQCRSCDEKFYDLKILRHHFRLVHTPKRSVRKTSWYRRSQRPRNSGLPRCGFCYRYFGTLQALEVHERVHAGVKPYKCDVCGRCFRQTVHLAVHLRTHTNERPFVCLVCQKSYKNRVDLRKHCVNKHGISLPVKRQSGVGAIDMVAAAVAAANIGPDDNDDPNCISLASLTT